MSGLRQEESGAESAGMVRAVFHVHTTFSWDGRITPDGLLRRCSELDIGLLVVTDHDTFEGSLTVAATARRLGLSIEVPVAAEIRTEHGDIVVMLPDIPNIEARRLKRWRDLVAAVRDMGGVISLAHPYRSHTEVERLAESCDTVEVFNARCTPEQNRRAVALSERFHLPGVVASDAHLLREIGGCVTLHSKSGDPLESLVNGAWKAESLTPARQSDIALAQATSGWRHRDVRRFACHGVRWAVWSLVDRL